MNWLKRFMVGMAVVLAVCLVAAPAAFAANAQQVESLIAGITYNDAPLAGGLVYTYAAGTTTNKTTWTDATKLVASTNPVVLDSQGRANIYADGSYKFVFKTSADVLVDTLDNLFYAIPSTTGFDVTQDKTADYLAVSTDDTIFVNAAGGDVTISLPTATTIEGKNYKIVKTDASANAVIIDPNGTETVNGSGTHTLSNQYDSVQIVSDGSNWLTVAQKLELLDEDDFASNSATAGATQQSIGAYIATPVIRDFTSATHAHNDAVGGGSLYTLGSIVGLAYEWASDTTVTLFPGHVEINGFIYRVIADLTLTFAGLGTDEKRFIMFAKPSSGNILTASNFTHTTTAPERVVTKGGGWYDISTGLKRCVGWIPTDSSDDLAQIKLVGSRMKWYEIPYAILSTSTPATALTAYSIGSGDSGLGRRVMAGIIADVIKSGVADATIFIDDGDTGSAAGNINQVAQQHVNGAGGDGYVEVLTDTSGQIKYAATSTSTILVWLKWVELEDGLRRN